MRNLKKVLALVLVLAFSLTMFAGAIETVFPFNDVDKLTAEQLDALKLLYPLGVIKGDGESVDPDGTYTRAQLAATLYRLYTGDAEEDNVSTFSTSCPYFTDVEDGKWYTPFINWAYIKGVILGYGDTRFGPNDPVTGVQAAAMLARLLGYEVEGEGWDLTARKIAVDNRLDAGVESKDLFGTNLSRGDMFVMVANTLNTAKLGADVTLAEEVFDLEVIEGAILLSTQPFVVGPHDETIFSFMDQYGKTLMFRTNLLKVNEKAETEEIGKKYTIYVSKSETYNGYRTLYAAYEWEQDNFYKVVEGMVNDGKLNTTKPDKADYLYKQMDPFSVTYIVYYVKGEQITETFGWKDDAFAAFKAGYNLKNYATYRLIDNDGDGLYEFLFIEELTLDAMEPKRVELLSVTAHNTVTGKYTLSDGKSYELGQYWVADAKGKPVSVKEADMRLVGTEYRAVSPVLFQFTLVGDYIMKVEVVKETQWAGQYVLSMGYTGGYNDTYKGMEYINFLTENNEHLYAYVSKVNDIDVRRTSNAFTPFNRYYGLYYINAYGNDTVELYTPYYASATTTYRTYNKLDEDFSPFWAGRHVGDVVRDNFSTATFFLYSGRGIQFELVTNVNGYNPNTEYYVITPDATGTYTWAYDALTYRVRSVYAPFFGEAEYKAQIMAQGDPRNPGSNITAKGEYLVTVVPGSKIDPIKLLGVRVEYNFGVKDYQIFKRYGNWYSQKYADLPAEYLDGTFVYNPNNYRVFFTSSLGETEVKYDVAKNIWLQVGKDGFEYITSETDPAAINTEVQNVITAMCKRLEDNTKDSPEGVFAYSVAEQLDMTHGVVFAYSRPINSPTAIYTWKAFHAEDLEGDKLVSFGSPDPDDDFKFVSGSVNPLALGVFDLDIDNMPPVYDEAFTAIDENGKVYVKAAKVTVAPRLDTNDVIAIDRWTAENSKLFFFGEVKGEFNAQGFTVQAMYPNGRTEEVFIPHSAGFAEYGTAGIANRGITAFGGVNFLALYGSLIYAVLDEDGNIERIEFVLHMADLALDAIINNRSGIGYSGYAVNADGTVWYTDDRDIRYSVKLDLEKAFFIEVNVATGEIVFVSAEKFAADHKNKPFEIYKSNAFDCTIVVDTDLARVAASRLEGKNIPDLIATPGYVGKWITSNYPGLVTRYQNINSYNYDPLYF